MVTINEYRDLHMPKMRILQNFDGFVRMVEQFTYYQTKVNNYRTALQVYCQAKNIEIDLTWESNSN